MQLRKRFKALPSKTKHVTTDCEKNGSSRWCAWNERVIVKQTELSSCMLSMLSNFPSGLKWFDFASFLFYIVSDSHSSQIFIFLLFWSHFLIEWLVYFSNTIWWFLFSGNLSCFRIFFRISFKSSDFSNFDHIS